MSGDGLIASQLLPVSLTEYNGRICNQIYVYFLTFNGFQREILSTWIQAQMNLNSKYTVVYNSFPFTIALDVGAFYFTASVSTRHRRLYQCTSAFLFVGEDPGTWALYLPLME